MITKSRPLGTILAILSISFFFCFAGSAKAEGTEAAPPASQQAPPAKQGAGTEAKPSARREDVDPETLAIAKDALKTARADRDKAETDLQAAQELMATVEKERNDARTELADAKGKLTIANAANKAAGEKFDKLTAALKGALALSDEQITNLVSDATIIPNAVEDVAKKKAVTIAASQGVPPVVTDPKQAAGGEDDIKADFKAASEEPDPMKRAVLMRNASERLAAKATKKTHGAN